MLVGSRHTAESLWEAIGEDPKLAAATRLGPPGVEVADLHAAGPGPRQRPPRRYRDQPRRSSRSARNKQLSRIEYDQPRHQPWWSRLAQGVADDLLVTFVGKLIVSKGIDLLLLAWPLVLAEISNARLAVVGFGAYREACERVVDALSRVT